MTQNYKWYRLLSKKEFTSNSWYGILREHGLGKNQTYIEFAPSLIENCNYKARTREEEYIYYAEWWNEHFGTKLHRHLYGVGNVD